MTQREVVIGHPLGLHARAAAGLVQLAAKFQSNIVLVRTDEVNPVEADGRSILSILLLAAGYGSRLQVHADGADEAEAIEKVCKYLAG